jgi:HD-GYP domain-containing protein (c-di-GMP phosphodiesterase class II)
VACRLPLPIRPRPAAEEGRAWICTRCATKHHGVLIEDAPAEIMNNVRPDEAEPFHCQSPSAAHTPQGEAKSWLPHRGAVGCDHETSASRALDKTIAQGESLTVQPEGPPFVKNVKRHGTRRYDAATEAHFVSHYDQSQQQVESLVKSLEQGRPLDVEAPTALTRESLARAAEDMDLFVRLGINPPRQDYMGKHSFHVAMLATAIGANLGWDEKTLVELGIGCLLHDIGMTRVPEEDYQNERVLKESEFDEIVRHPLHTFDILASHYSTIPLVSRMVAYQIHERCDGSGYPRRRQGAAIHQAAKVAAVADVYVALVSSRLHRPALMPYYAVEHLIYGVKSGLFDSTAVRGLLKTISLFPIGSFLALRDGRVSRVIRANPEHFGRPVIESWQPGRLDSVGEVIDLAAASELAVVGPLPRLEPA